MDLYNVLKHPVITEKSLSLAEQNKYIFIVDKSANKHEIEKAIKKLFNVEVLDVRTANFKGKRKRILGSRRFMRKKAFKKAVVTLKEGQNINIFEKDK